MLISLRHTQTEIKPLFASDALEPFCAPCKPEDMPIMLEQIRESRGLRLEDLAEKLGVAISTIQRWEKATMNIPSVRLPAIADAYGISIAQIFGEVSASHEPIRTIPHLGSVPAGGWKAAVQRATKRIPVSDPDTPPNAYALTVEGDSMDLIVDDGTTIVIDPDDTDLWPGWRYVVMTEDGETTFKEYQESPARLVPCSSNPAHKEIPLGSAPIKILGRVFSYSMRDLPRRKS